MLVSVFTPSHDPARLAHTYQTLKNQTYQNWEWIVVPNGAKAAAVKATVVHASNNDQRLRIVDWPVKHKPDSEYKIGALKRLACESATGDLLVELDHDDKLTADCLATLVETAKSCPSATFLYSDSVACNSAGQTHYFMESFGWRHYECELEGKKYGVNQCFPISARSLSEILYSPNHVRAWTRDAYLIAGGHSVDLPVGDDHELLIRTYIKGVHFQFISRPIYIQQQDGQTTSQTRTAEIQRLSYMHRNIYMDRLLEEWCRREKLEMFDIGDPANTPKGYKSIWYTDNADIRWNINQEHKPLWSMLPNNVGVLRCYDYLQTLTPEQSVTFMNQAYMLLPQGSWLLTHTPAVTDEEGKIGRGAFQDPRHKSFWSMNNFWYFTKQQSARYCPTIKCRYQAVRGFHYYPSDWHKENQIPYVLFDMIAIKDDKAHHPGPVDI